MEAIDAITLSGSTTPITVTTAPTSVASAYALAAQTIQEGGKPAQYDASDATAIKALLEGAIAGSNFIPLDKLNGPSRLSLQLMIASNSIGAGGQQGIEDLYLVLKSAAVGALGQHVMLVDVGRVTWTAGTEQLGTTGLYLPSAVSIESSGAASMFTGSLADIQPFPASGYARSGAGRAAWVTIFDRGPAMGLLRVMCRASSASNNNGVVGRHLRWR